MRRSGIDFEALSTRGIDVEHFGELLISSGLVLTDDVRVWHTELVRMKRLRRTCFQTKGIDVICELVLSQLRLAQVHWVSFSGGYDFGYLLKVLSCVSLPAGITKPTMN